MGSAVQFLSVSKRDDTNIERQLIDDHMASKNDSDNESGDGADDDDRDDQPQLRVTMQEALACMEKLKLFLASKDMSCHIAPL